LTELVPSRAALVSLSQHSLAAPLPEPQLTKAVTEALHHAPSVYDSHPSPTERTRWVRALNARGSAASAEDGDEVWLLFANRQAIEERMTGKVRDMLYASQRIPIPGLGTPLPSTALPAL